MYFELCSPIQENIGIDSVWATRPQAGVSFAADAQAPADTVWRVNLPADVAAATVILGEADRKLQMTEEALTGVASRLDDVLRAESPPPPGRPEAELLAFLQAARPSDQAVSFGLGDRLPTQWTEGLRRIDAFIAQAKQVTLHFAWVETHIGGELLARSVVGWLGDFNTVWLREDEAANRALHQRALGLAIRSREALLRTFLVIAQSAAKLTLMLSAGAWLMALPAAWKYVRDILSEIDNLQDVLTETRR